MAIFVSYDHEYLYPYDDRGARSPILQVQLMNPSDPSMVIEVDADLDSGTGRSLFDGQIAPAIGLQLMEGRPQMYSSTARYGISARVHQVVILHPDLGRFVLEIGFSEQEIRRNLLGRDFFDLIQIGFRERHSAFFVTASP